MRLLQSVTPLARHPKILFSGLPAQISLKRCSSDGYQCLARRLRLCHTICSEALTCSPASYYSGGGIRKVITMMKRISLSFVCLLGLIACGPLLSTVHAQDRLSDQVDKRDRIQAFILRSPSVVTAGADFGALAGVFNSGHNGVLVAIDFFLVDENLRRINIGHGKIGVRPNTRRTTLVRCSLPRHVAPGRYQLVMSARTRNGPTQLDRVRISVAEITPDDIDPTPLRIMDAYKDLK